ncbi:MAG: HAD-IIIA family hydrolase [Desulfobulbaceae bacterium]|jgi:3-deoxy-D-manno-octulosonate 8-phosphate phosphatase (KDO 8-P phosphatase)|nr:HAD-IIIA family hydrolase [Desulfobulbaceae bacterium]
MDDSCVSGGKGDYPGDCEFTQSLLKRAAARTENALRGYAWKNCFDRAREIKLLLLDVDGVLTDGTITYTDEGVELKSFNVKDGFGLNLLRQAGVEVGIITARSSKALIRRCQDLKIDHLHQGKRHKVEVYKSMLADLHLEPHQVAYVGDDWLDLPMFGQVGFAVTVADGMEELKEVAHYTTKSSGGRGAVREVCDLIIDAKGKYESLLAGYLGRV